MCTRAHRQTADLSSLGPTPQRWLHQSVVRCKEDHCPALLGKSLRGNDATIQGARDVSSGFAPCPPLTLRLPRLRTKDSSVCLEPTVRRRNNFGSYTVVQETCRTRRCHARP
jgi:hypothetical protein